MKRNLAVSAVCLLDTIDVNVHNLNLTDAEFREFVCNSLIAVRNEFEAAAMQANGLTRKDLPERMYALSNLT